MEGCDTTRLSSASRALVRSWSGVELSTSLTAQGLPFHSAVYTRPLLPAASSRSPSRWRFRSVSKLGRMTPTPISMSISTPTAMAAPEAIPMLRLGGRSESWSFRVAVVRWSGRVVRVWVWAALRAGLREKGPEAWRCWRCWEVLVCWWVLAQGEAGLLEAQCVVRASSTPAAASASHGIEADPDCMVEVRPRPEDLAACRAEGKRMWDWVSEGSLQVVMVGC